MRPTMDCSESEMDGGRICRREAQPVTGRTLVRRPAAGALIVLGALGGLGALLPKGVGAQVPPPGWGPVGPGMPPGMAPGITFEVPEEIKERQRRLYALVAAKLGVTAEQLEQSVAEANAELGLPADGPLQITPAGQG